jgi:micrococcal nuclease
MQAMRWLVWVVALFGGAALPFLAAAAPLTSQEAGSHIGETATVCGTVASATYATRTKGQPTFLNLDQPYPRQVFTILIWGTDRPKFGEPEVRLLGKRLCATGVIQSYKGKPEIVATDPRQLTSQ